MIDGTPAGLVMLISMTSVNQFLRAYSSRYTAPAMPSGTATSAVTSITSTDPTQADRMPAWPARRDGNDVKNSAVRRGTPETAMSTKSATSVRMPTARAISPSRPKIMSQRLWRRMMPRSSSALGGRRSMVGVLISVGFPEPAAHPVADQVERQRQQHQREAGGEDRLVADAAVRQVAQRHLHDV